MLPVPSPLKHHVPEGLGSNLQKDQVHRVWAARERDREREAVAFFLEEWHYGTVVKRI